MKYEFGPATWIEENPEGGISGQDLEKMHQDVEDRIRASIEELLASQENFLGEGKTAEVHFLNSDKKLCYKIMRKVDVMARPDAVANLPEKYRQVYDKKMKALEKGKRPSPTSSSHREELQDTWHVDLLTEASFLNRAREVDPEGPVKIPRPYARLEISGREEGEGFEVHDDIRVLLMETMDAVAVDDLMRKGMTPPESFNHGKFCEDVEDFIEKMHGRKLYHRDLHAGNVMIERETGRPCIIDFGRSGISTEDEAYIEEVKPGVKMHFVKDEQMFRDKVKVPLSQYLDYKGLTEFKK